MNFLTRKEALWKLEDELGSEELAEKAIKFFENNIVQLKHYNVEDYFKSLGIDFDSLIEDTINDALSNLIFDLKYNLEKEIKRVTIK